MMSFKYISSFLGGFLLCFTLLSLMSSKPIPKSTSLNSSDCIMLTGTIVGMFKKDQYGNSTKVTGYNNLLEMLSAYGRMGYELKAVDDGTFYLCK